MASNSAADQRAQRELMQIATQEQAKAEFNTAVLKITRLCFDQCVSRPQAKLGYSGEQCFTNCAGRFVDASEVAAQSVAQAIQSQSSGMM